MDAIALIAWLLAILAIVAAGVFVVVRLLRAASNRPREMTFRYAVPWKQEDALVQLSEPVTKILERTDLEPAWQDATLLCFARSLTDEVVFKTVPREGGCEVIVSGRLRPDTRAKLEELLAQSGEPVAAEAGPPPPEPITVGPRMRARRRGR